MTNSRSDYAAAATLPPSGHPSVAHVAIRIDRLGQQLEGAACAFDHLSAGGDLDENSFERVERIT